MSSAKNIYDIAGVEEEILYSLECIERILESKGLLSQYIYQKKVSPGLWKKAGYDEDIVTSLRDVSKNQFLGYKDELKVLLENVRSFSPVRYSLEFKNMFVSEDAFFAATRWLEDQEYLKNGSINHEKINNAEYIAKLFWSLNVLGYTSDRSCRDIEEITAVMGGKVGHSTIAKNRLTTTDVGIKSYNNLFYNFPKYEMKIN